MRAGDRILREIHRKRRQGREGREEATEFRQGRCKNSNIGPNRFQDALSRRRVKVSNGAAQFIMTTQS